MFAQSARLGTRRRWQFAAVAVSAPLVLSACGSGSDSTGGSTDEAVSGGTLRVAVGNETECRDPQQDQFGFGSTIGRQIVDSLTERSIEDPTEIEPWLATSWEVSDDARTYTFTLREGVTFSDGAELNAEVVKDNFETLQGLTGTGAAFVEPIESIETPDDLTVEINFTDPNAAFLQATSQYQLGILSPASLELSGEERCAQGVIGSGPFVVDSVSQNEETTLVRRDGYNWASDARSHQGEAFLDEIIFSVVPESSVRTGSLTSGQIDLSPLAFQDAEASESAGIQLLPAPNKVPAVSLEVNTSRGVLAEQDVRVAFRHAIDREDLVEKAHSGFTNPATGALTAASPFHLDQSELLAYDPDQSRQILEDAGWVEGDDGIRERDGEPLSFSVSYFSNPDNTRFLEIIQEQVRQVGIDFRLEPASQVEFEQLLVAGEYDTHRWSGALIDGDVLRTLFSAQTLNKAQLPEDNDLDPLLTAQAGEADPEVRRELINEIQEIVVGRGYQIPIFDMVTLYGAGAGVSGVKFDDSAILLYEATVE